MAQEAVFLILNLMWHDILLKDAKEFPHALGKGQKLGQSGY